MKKITDPIELIIFDALTEAKIQFTHESQNSIQRPDFILDISGVAIECKQYPTDRTEKQLMDCANIILIQGRLAAHAFANMIKSK